MVCCSYCTSFLFLHRFCARTRRGTCSQRRPRPVLLHACFLKNHRLKHCRILPIFAGKLHMCPPDLTKSRALECAKQAGVSVALLIALYTDKISIGLDVRRKLFCICAMPSGVFLDGQRCRFWPRCKTAHCPLEGARQARLPPRLHFEKVRFL